MIPVITSLLSLGGTWLEGKQKQTEATLEAKLVEIKADSDIKKAKAIAITKMAQEGQAQNYDLDRLAMEQMTKSWKDELLLIVFPSTNAYGIYTRLRGTLPSRVYCYRSDA